MCVYKINHVNLVRVKVVKDLVVWFEEKSNFVEHVSRISISLYFGEIIFIKLVVYKPN